MKHLLLILALLLLLPLPAYAVKLANCGGKPVTVMINNAGAKRTVTLYPADSPIEEFGPMVTFRLKGQPEVRAENPYEEFCIWGGRIRVQRLNTFNTGTGGFRLR